ncbi:DUF6221 family protein (plasmid) [Streptomyces sp. LZ34]
MTAQGEDILAWTENAITRVEKAALHATKGPWRTHDTHLDLGGHTATILVGRGNDTELLAWLPTMSHESWDETRNAWNNADHIALNDPEAVLRRCAADRKLIYEVRRTAANAKSRPWDPIYAPYADAMMQALKVVAEGYGWTEGK